jgi:hypothetical protein
MQKDNVYEEKTIKSRSDQFKKKKKMVQIKDHQPQHEIQIDQIN